MQRGGSKGVGRIASCLLSGWVVLVSCAGARGAYAQPLNLTGKGTVQYRAVHKFHTVIGRSSALEVRGEVDAGGLKVEARAPVRSFDSGNSNRDVHVMEAVEADKYPWVSVRAALPGFTWPAQTAATPITVEAAVELHGVSVTHPIVLTLESRDATHLHVQFQFIERMSDHAIKRPSLFFIPVNDEMDISGSVEVEARR